MIHVYAVQECDASKAGKCSIAGYQKIAGIETNQQYQYLCAKKVFKADEVISAIGAGTVGV